MKNFFLTLFSTLSLFAPLATQAQERIDIWPSIPFIRGADLCKYNDAYSSTRTEYMREMVENATDLMQSGAFGDEALEMLVAFNALYERNQAIATPSLDTTLESTLKAYLDQHYREIRPRFKRLSFTHTADLLTIVRNAQRGFRITPLDERQLEQLDYIAYGTYALAPDCKGDIQVTLHLIGRQGSSESFIGRGRPETVMSQISSQLFTRFQRTEFPSVVRIGDNDLHLVGGMNGSIDSTHSPKMAENACANLGARLPNPDELEILDSMGDWSGGISLNNQTWALNDNMVYAPYLRNPNPVRNVNQVNARKFSYYCVR